MIPSIGIPMMLVGGSFEATFSSPALATYYRNTNALQANAYGNTLAEFTAFYVGTTLESMLAAGTMKIPLNGYQWFLVPETGNYKIEAQGGIGGYTNVSGRTGCNLKATFSLAKNDILWIACGRAGSTGNELANDRCSAGGGGATVVAYTPSDTSISKVSIGSITRCLIMAAGGLGAKENIRNGGLRPAVSRSAIPLDGTQFGFNAFKLNTVNGVAGGYGGYYGCGGFMGGSATDDSEGGAGGYNNMWVINPNSFVDPSGTNITRIDEGNLIWPASGYVKITKI